MMQAGLIAQLTGNAAVAALIGARVFESAMAPDMTQLPCAAFSLVGGSVEPTFRTSGVIRQRVEVNGFALDYPTAAAIRLAILQALDGWAQKLSDGTNVLNTVILNPGTDFVSEQLIFRCLAEFYVFFTLPS